MAMDQFPTEERTALLNPSQVPVDTGLRAGAGSLSGSACLYVSGWRSIHSLFNQFSYFKLVCEHNYILLLRGRGVNASCCH